MQQLAANLPLIELILIVMAVIIGSLTASLALRANRKSRIARDRIINDLKSRKLTMMSFETIRNRIDASYSDEFLSRLPVYFPNKLRKATLAGGRIGLARILDENEIAPPESLEAALEPWERRVRDELNRTLQDRAAAQSIAALIGIADQAIRDGATDYSQGKQPIQLVSLLLGAADSLAEEALSQQPESPEVLISQATVRKRQALLIGDVQHKQQRDSLLSQAIDLCSRALQFDPRSERAFYNRACYRALKGDDLGLIVADIKKAIALLPEDKHLFAAEEHDIDSVRNNPEVAALLRD